MEMQTNITPRFCTSCGFELLEDSEFCSNCGLKIEKTPQFVNPKEEISSVAIAQSISETNRANATSVCVEPNAPTVSGANNKQRFCKKCGTAIDTNNIRCTGCGKRHFRLKEIIVPLILALLFMFSAALNVQQYLKSQEDLIMIASQAQDIEVLKTSVSNQKKTISDLESTNAIQKQKVDSLEKKAKLYDQIATALRSDKLGYADGHFKSSESIIVVSKNETGRKFKLTANWSNGGTVYYDYSSSAAYVSFDNDSWYEATQMTVIPRSVGVTTVTFSNSVNSKKFDVVIIVTD